MARAAATALAALPLLVIVAGTSAQEPAPARAPGAIYHLEAGPVSAKELSRRFTADQLALLEMLNRATVTHLERLETLVVPEVWTLDPLAHSPFPAHFAWAAAHSKALIVHQPAQAFAAYLSGRLVRWGPVSSGRRVAATPSGLFHLNWRSTGRHSTVDPDWFMPWYFNSTTSAASPCTSSPSLDGLRATLASACSSATHVGCTSGENNGPSTNADGRF